MSFMISPEGHISLAASKIMTINYKEKYDIITTQEAKEARKIVLAQFSNENQKLILQQVNQKEISFSST